MFGRGSGGCFPEAVPTASLVAGPLRPEDVPVPWPSILKIILPLSFRVVISSEKSQAGELGEEVLGAI